MPHTAASVGRTGVGGLSAHVRLESRAVSEARPNSTPLRPVRVLIACPGLEHAPRGFESFARECFEVLRTEPALDLELAKGSGAGGPRERTLPTLRRDTALARQLGRALDREPFVPEHVSFAASLTLHALSSRPHVVYFSEWHLGRVLALARGWAGRHFRLVFCNGASAPGPYDHLDFVQQLSPGALEWVVARGQPAERQTVLPLGVAMPAAVSRPSAQERASLRRELGLSLDRPVVLTVAALNRQKRIDYVVRELAALPEPRPFLLAAGAEEQDTPPLRALADSLLGAGGYSMVTVDRPEVDRLYRAADVFVLASLWEGLPRVLIEAMSWGLPCIAHRWSTTEYIVGEHAYLEDLRGPGALARTLGRLEDSERTGGAVARHAQVHRLFSWESLRPRYVELLLAAAASPPRGLAT